MNDNELFAFKNNFESTFSYRAVEYITKEYYRNLGSGNSLIDVSYTVEFDSYVDVINKKVITKATRVYGELLYDFKYEIGYVIFSTSQYFPAQRFDYNANEIICEKDINEINLDYWIDDYNEMLENAIDSFELDLELENKDGKFVKNRLPIKEKVYIS